MKIKKRKTTREDYEFFQECCNKYRDWMGCHEWNIVFNHETSEGCDGECYYDFEAKRCTLCIGKQIDADSDVSCIAKHETAEAVLSNLDWCAKQWITSSIVNEYRHEVINHIVKLLEMIEKEKET